MYFVFLDMPIDFVYLDVLVRFPQADVSRNNVMPDSLRTLPRLGKGEPFIIIRLWNRLVSTSQH